jgi:hypothetical protein
MFKNVDEFINSDVFKLVFLSGFSSCLNVMTDEKEDLHKIAAESGDPNSFMKALNGIRDELFEEFKSFIKTNWEADVER